MISPYRIKFRNQTNVDFDMIVGAAFEGDSGNTESFLTKESASSNTYDGSRRNVHGYSYTDVMNVSFTLIKQDYTDITDRERRKLYAWLTGSNKVEELTIYKDDSEVISYRLLGQFTNVEHYKLGNGRDVGVVVTFEHIAPYAYSPVKSITKTITTPETFELVCKTDVYEKPLYPRITVTVGDSIFLPVTEDPSVDTFEMIENVVYDYNGTYYIKLNGQKHAITVTPNQIEDQGISVDDVGTYCLSTSDRTVYIGVVVNDTTYGWQKVVAVGAGFEIKNTYDGEVVAHSIVTDCFVDTNIDDTMTSEAVTLDGDNKIISSSYGGNKTSVRIFGDSFNWEWIYLLPGKNEITVSGNCTVTIEWTEPMKIGNM